MWFMVDRGGLWLFQENGLTRYSNPWLIIRCLICCLCVANDPVYKFVDLLQITQLQCRVSMVSLATMTGYS